MRIGIFGGSFDPVHVGHLLVAECCREQARLDRVVFMPAAVSPHKQDRPPTPAADRLEMLRLATGGHPAFTVSTVELDRGGVSYTADTLEALAAACPDDRFLLLLGPDALASLPRWHEPVRVLARAEIVAVERDGLDDVAALVATPALAALLGPRAATIASHRVRVPAVGIRASDLRSAVAVGGSIRYRTPRAVECYIAAHGLYRGS
jgi:nicotinate-nucleotide adenylyltransferase